MKKIGILRCQQAEDRCPITLDYKVATEGSLVFEGTRPAQIVDFVSCGGCPGKQAVARSKLMVERGAESIVFASCISKGNPLGFPCPHYTAMREAIIRAVGEKIQVIDYMH
jgi:predicted metal-binding protein